MERRGGVEEGRGERDGARSRSRDSAYSRAADSEISLRYWGLSSAGGVAGGAGGRAGERDHYEEKGAGVAVAVDAFRGTRHAARRAHSKSLSSSSKKSTYSSSSSSNSPTSSPFFRRTIPQTSSSPFVRDTTAGLVSENRDSRSPFSSSNSPTSPFLRRSSTSLTPVNRRRREEGKNIGVALRGGAKGDVNSRDKTSEQGVCCAVCGVSVSVSVCASICWRAGVWVKN